MAGSDTPGKPVFDSPTKKPATAASQKKVSDMNQYAPQRTRESQRGKNKKMIHEGHEVHEEGE